MEPNALGVPDVALAVADWASGCLDSADCFRLRVAVAEALNNIILHGTVERDMNHRIVIECQDSRHTLCICISQNNSKPIPLPVNADIPDPMSESGRGWPILFHWLDEVRTQHIDGRNRLTLIKYR